MRTLSNKADYTYRILKNAVWLDNDEDIINACEELLDYLQGGGA